MGPLLRSGAVWLYTLLYLGAALAINLLTLRRLPPRWGAVLIRGWGKGSLRILGIRLELLNPSTLEESRPRIMVTNHQSVLDLLWGAALCPPGPLAIGKREVIYVPVLNLAWWAFDFVRIDRANRTTSIDALGRAGRKIRDGRRTLIIAPEGTRTPDGSILPFKKGAFHLACETGVPIYPLVIWGAYELLPKHALLPKRGVIRVRFLDPIDPAGLTEDALLDRVRGEMVRAFGGPEAPIRSSSSSS